jgi:NAD(P)-dependent dehydrogenase (short-subunit alcohol dehydrogenase family)
MDIPHRTYIVTGGGSGLGAATARELAERGARVVVADLQGNAPDGGEFVRTDVTVAADVTELIERATAGSAPLSGVVNCAGIGTPKKILARDGVHSQDDFLTVLAVNLGGTFNVLRLAVAAMRDNEPSAGGNEVSS